MVTIMKRVTKSNISSLIGSREIYESSEYPFTKAQLFRRIEKGEFPKPMQVASQFYWLRSDIKKYFAEKGVS